MHKNHGLTSMFDVCPGISGDSAERLPWWFPLISCPRSSPELGSAMFWLFGIADFACCWSSSTAFGIFDELFGYELISEQPLRPPLVVFLPLRSSRLHRLGYLSIAIHHDFHFIALLRSSTVDDIYVVGHAVSDSCLLLSFASLNYLKIFNF